MMIKTLCVLAAMITVPFSALWADETKILGASARQSGNSWSFDVTLRHADTGWDHYADIWTVNTPDGKEIGRRTLAHPHENEQPFTRSLSGVSVPEGVSRVVIRAHDTVHGWSKKTYSLKLK